VAVVAGCGGSDSSSSSSSSSTPSESSSSTPSEGSSNSGDAVQAEAAKLVAKAEEPPAEVPEALPLKNTNIPKGKSVTFLGSGTETGEAMFVPIEEGAKALGWSAKMYPGSFEPNKLVGQLQSIVRERPDVFIALATTPSLGRKYFNELKANGTVTILCCTKPAGTEGIVKLISGPKDKTIPGEWAADSLLAAKGEELHALYVYSKAFEIYLPYLEGFENEVSRLCTACTVDTLDVAGEDIGKPALTTAVVSYLRSHPEINAIGWSFSDLAIGVPAAMKAAGLEMPFTTVSSGPIASEAMKEGGKENWAYGVLFGKEWGLWGLNVAVRTMTGEPVSEETRSAEVLISTNNAGALYEAHPTTGTPWVVSDALEQYEKLWGLK
jgi:ribose transport system substrate-binding protein